MARILNFSLLSSANNRPSPTTVFSKSFKISNGQNFNSHQNNNLRKFKKITYFKRLNVPITCLMPDNTQGGSGSSSSISVGDRIGADMRKLLKLEEQLDKRDNKDKEETENAAHIDIKLKDMTWQNWLDYFFDMDNLYYERECLSEDLRKAIAEESYSEASKIKSQIKKIDDKNIIYKAEMKLLDAIRDEKFEYAAKLRDEGMLGIKGWWIVRSANDPYGFLVHFDQGMSKYKGKAYSTKDIAKANGWIDQSLSTMSTGIGDVNFEDLGKPSIEIYLKEDETGKIQHQACALQMPKMKKSEMEMSLNEIADDFVIESEKDDNGNLVKMTFTVVNSDDENEISDSELENEEEEEDDDDEEDDEPLIIPVEDTSDDDEEEEEDEDEIEELTKDSNDEFQKTVVDVLEMNYRIPAYVKWWDRDHFVVNVPEDPNNKEKVKKVDEEININEEILTNLGIDIMKEGKDKDKDKGIGKASSSSSFIETKLAHAKNLANIIRKIRLKAVEKQKNNTLDVDVDDSYLPQINEFIRLATAQKKQSKITLKGEIMFSRVPSDFISTDPFSGLFMGAFGPHGPELLHLTRQKDLETGEEYVEGRKLTGDPNVPAGEASFRVKIGRKCRLNTRGIYPEELGIKARYKGLGRVAEHGYKNPRWVDGELLQFAPGSNSMLTGGAELGFVWAVPGSRRFLILLNRLTFPNT